MGRTITGYFGASFVDVYPQSYGGHKSDQFLVGYGGGLFMTAGVAANADWNYKFRPRGRLNGSDPSWNGFSTYSPISGTLTMAQDEYPTSIRFVVDEGYKTEFRNNYPHYPANYIEEGLKNRSNPNDPHNWEAPNFYLCEFKDDFNNGEYNDKQNLDYNPANYGVPLFKNPDVSTGNRVYVPPQGFLDTNLLNADENPSDRWKEKLRGKRLCIYRQGGSADFIWIGRHQIKIETNYIAYTVTVDNVEHGTGYAEGQRTFNQVRDGYVNLTAVPHEGYKLVGWETTAGKIEPYGDTYRLQMPAPAENVTVKPLFDKIEYYITTVANPSAGGTVTSNPTSIEWGKSPQLSYTTNVLYRFEGWSLTDNIQVGNDGKFVMPMKNVTATANFLKHEILWTYCNLTIDQDEYTLTFIKNDDVYDTFDAPNTSTLTFKLYRNNTYITDFDGDIATVTLTDAQIGTSYNYEVRAYTKNDNITAIVNTYDYAVYRITLAASPVDGGSAFTENDVSIAEQGKEITLIYHANNLYRFDSWSTNDVTITSQNKFVMPNKNVTITANFAKHQITWENASLTVEQNEYDLTFTKSGTVSDSNNIPFGFKLLRDGIDLGVTFDGDTATYRMTDAEVEKEYEYTVVAYSLQDDVSTTGATITFRSQGVHKTIGYFDGTKFVPCIPYYYNGEGWVEVYPYYFDGTDWQLCSIT